MKIKSLLLLLIIFSSVYAYANPTSTCELNSFDISRAGFTGIAFRVYDNGACNNYKFYEIGTNSFSFKDETMKVKILKTPKIDPYSRSKIRSVIIRDCDIVFNFDYPFQAKRIIEGGSIIFVITPDPETRLIDNEPIVNLTNIRCDKSLSTIAITLDNPTRYSYQRVDDNVSYVDLFETTLPDTASSTKDCRSELSYEYLDNPTRLRLMLATGRYSGMKAFSKDGTNILINHFGGDQFIYITKVITKKNPDNQTLELVFSNGVVTNIIELSKQEHAIEINDNFAKIMNIQHERRFTDSYITSILKQRMGVKDRIVVRVDKDTTTKIEKTSGGVIISATK